LLVIKFLGRYDKEWIREMMGEGVIELNMTPAAIVAATNNKGKLFVLSHFLH